MDPAFSLDGQTAIVTGASRGIGQAIAAAFVEAGARVILTARGEGALMKAAASLGPNALAMRCDNSDPQDIERMVGEAWRLGPVDILVNNAGISPYYKRAELVTVADWDQVVDVNLRGMYFASVEFARRVFGAERAGVIVNVSSVAGLLPLDRLAVYSATKAGVHQLTKALALEWADRQVRVNAIAPGWTETDFTSGLFASRHGEKLLADVPMGRLAVPGDIAGAAVFLASSAASYITGAILPIDGGRALR